MKKLLSLFEDYLKDSLPQVATFHPFYNDAISQMIKGGGKRFRPMLLLGVVDEIAPEMVKNALSVACGVEYLHTYSLIHDDLPAMDNADLRRGVPTLHVTYDEVTAILVGDALNTHAFSMIAHAPLSNDVKVKLTTLLADNGGISGMVLGQAIDCHFGSTKGRKLEFDELVELHTLKTAKLIAASLAMGGAISDTTAELEGKLYSYGIMIGIAFQIRDDLIDVLQDSDQSGKTAGRDEDKFSFVTLLGVNEAKEKLNFYINEAQKIAEYFPENLKNRLYAITTPYLTL
jgi:farnesyl diphosphate synthase